MTNYNTKQCFRCKEYLPASPNYFYKYYKRSDGLIGTCVKCLTGKYRDVEKFENVKDGYKRCTKCERELPETEGYFYPHERVGVKSQFVAKCRECYCKGGKFVKIPEEGYKVCVDCNKELLANNANFHRSPTGKLGFKAACKTCCNKRAAEYYKRNDEKRREFNRKHYEENREVIQKRHKEYKRNNPHIHAGYTTRRRTRLAGLAHSFSEEEWNVCKERFNQKCAYCGQDEKLMRDHFIPLSKGGEFTKNNVIPSCNKCNASKNDRDFFEWYPRFKEYSKTRENEILKYLNYTEDRTQQLALF